VTVLGPLALLQAGKKPTGVRRIEAAVPDFAKALRGTVAIYETTACLDALDQCIVLYRSVRSNSVERRTAAEAEAVRYLDQQRRF